jgi:hypothetical protein
MQFLEPSIFYALLFDSTLAKYIFLIRNAETPWNKRDLIRQDNPIGLNLTQSGLKRATCLAQHVFGGKAPQITNPTRIISRYSGKRYNYDSTHPNFCHDTVLGVSLAFNIPIEDQCEDMGCVVKTIKDKTSVNSPILISWSRYGLRRILKKLDIQAPKYPKDRFDLIWVAETDNKTISEYTQDCSEYGLFNNGTIKTY